MNNDSQLKCFRFTISTFIVASCIGAAAESPTAGQLIGHWYMGTMTGQDCNLVITADGTLRIQYGSCFGHGPWTESAWRLEGNRILISNPALQSKLGMAFSISQYKGNTILVPDSHSHEVKQTGFRVNLCFWKNLLGDRGLELPNEASHFQ